MVTLNRVDHDWFPDTICDVVFQDSQFSWTFQLEDAVPTDHVAWANSWQVAQVALSDFADDPSDGSLFYHADYVDPPWADEVELAVQIDKHIFYRWDGVWD